MYIVNVNKLFNNQITNNCEDLQHRVYGLHVFVYFTAFSQLSLERDYVISELVESSSTSVRIEEVGRASEEREMVSMVGRLTGLLGVSSSSLGAELL